MFLSASRAHSQTITALAVQIDSINSLVRDNQIAKTVAQDKLSKLFLEIKKHYLTRFSVDSGNTPNPVSVAFPMLGYTSSAIGGKNGSGYVLGGYDFYSGNRHTGHPSHDLFIFDRNQDGLDDRTKAPVKVVTLAAGIVVARATGWKRGDSQRGGNYIWIYSPLQNRLYYYAHNASVHVEIGQSVKAGDAIATVGRTGLNAEKSRSPTHLHLTVLSVDSALTLPPVNTYRELISP